MENEKNSATTRIDATFDIAEQTKRQTAEWEKLALTVRIITPRVVVWLAVGIIALAAGITMFAFIGKDNGGLAIAAVVAAVIAALGISSSVTDIVLARGKRKKMLPRLLEHINRVFEGVPSPCPFSAVFDGDAVNVRLGDKTDTVPVSDCSAVEFDGMLAIDFGNFCGLCFTKEELGGSFDGVREIITECGERYQYLEPDGKLYALYDK